MSKFNFKSKISHREYDYEINDGKVNVNGEIYNVSNNKVIIDGNTYDVFEIDYILIGNSEYPVQNNKVLNITNEYVIKGGQVEIKYPIIDDKITIGYDTYSVIKEENTKVVYVSNSDPISSDCLERYEIVGNYFVMSYPIQKIKFITIKPEKDYKDVKDDNIFLKNSYSCVIECQILNNDELTNSYELEYDETDWIKVKKNYVNIGNSENNKQQSVITFYVDDNYSSDKRYFYVNVIDNNSGDITTLSIIQNGCYYDIQFSKDIGEIDAESDKEVCKFINLKVYGGSKTLSLTYSAYSDNDIDKEDYGLILSNIKYKHMLNYPYNEYKVDINYIGYTNEDTDYYIIYFYNENNSDTKKELRIKIKKEEQIGIEDVLLEQFNKMCDKQRSECKTKQDYNKELIQNAKAISALIDDVSIINEDEEENKTFVPLEEKKIEKNKIYIVSTNRYGEHDSQIIVGSYALWCHATHKYDYDNEMHIITVFCDKNLSNRNRKTMINIKNAETMGGDILYIVEQDVNSNIKMMRD